MAAKVFFTTAFLALLVCLPNSAYAYIDPGSGSMFLQLLLAGLAGIGVAAKLYWRRFIGIFRRSSTSTETKYNETNSNPE